VRNAQVFARHRTTKRASPFCSDHFAAQCLFDFDRRAGIAMADETTPANDYQDAGIVDVAARDKLDKVVLSIARLIGRQIAREHFEAQQAANDNQVSPNRAEAPGEEGRSGAEGEAG
jgi:hypothetical protein